MSVITLGTIQAAIHFFKKTSDSGENLAFLASLNQDELALAASVKFTNIDQKAMAFVGIVDIEQERFRTCQSEYGSQFDTGGQKWMAAENFVSQAFPCAYRP